MPKDTFHRDDYPASFFGSKEVEFCVPGDCVEGYARRLNFMRSQGSTPVLEPLAKVPHDSKKPAYHFSEPTHVRCPNRPRIRNCRIDSRTREQFRFGLVERTAGKGRRHPSRLFFGSGALNKESSAAGTSASNHSRTVMRWNDRTSSGWSFQIIPLASCAEPTKLRLALR